MDIVLALETLDPIVLLLLKLLNLIPLKRNLGIMEDELISMKKMLFGIRCGCPLIVMLLVINGSLGPNGLSKRENDELLSKDYHK